MSLERSIHDNIMLIQQMTHYHNETNTRGGMVFVDFSHAYDYISQEYILQVLATMDFSPNFISLVATLTNEQKGRVLHSPPSHPPSQVANWTTNLPPKPGCQLVAPASCRALFTLPGLASQCPASASQCHKLVPVSGWLVPASG